MWIGCAFKLGLIGARRNRGGLAELGEIVAHGRQVRALAARGKRKLLQTIRKLHFEALVVLLAGVSRGRSAAVSPAEFLRKPAAVWIYRAYERGAG